MVRERENQEDEILKSEKAGAKGDTQIMLEFAFAADSNKAALSRFLAYSTYLVVSVSSADSSWHRA